MSYSSDGRHIILATSDQVVEILEEDTGETVFKSGESDQEMKLQDAKSIVRNCGPMATILWTFPFERHEFNMCSVPCSCCSLNVNNILNFVPFSETFHFNAQFCNGTLATRVDNRLQIFKLEWNNPLPFTSRRSIDRPAKNDEKESINPTGEIPAMQHLPIEK